MKIHITAPLLTKSGYGVHSRQIFEIIKKYCTTYNHELTVNGIGWGACGWYLKESELNGLVGNILKHNRVPVGTVDLHIIVGLPEDFVRNWNIRQRRIIGVTAGIEATECNPLWKTYINKPEIYQVIVPSEFTKKTLVSGGCSHIKISVVPECYYEDCNKVIEPFDLGSVPEQNVLIVSQVNPNPTVDRKNFQNTVAAADGALKAFGSSVGIVLKVNSVGRGSMDRMKTRESLKLLKQRLRSDVPITMIHGEMSDSQMVALYKNPKISCLFSMTRGEGFGLPLLEAAACGLPVIASNWSAHTEFLGDHFIKLPGKEILVPPERIDGTIWTGGKWFDPDGDKAAKLLYRFFNESDFNSSAKQNAEILQKSVQNRYSLNNIYSDYETILGSVLKR